MIKKILKKIQEPCDNQGPLGQHRDRHCEWYHELRDHPGWNQSQRGC